MPSLMCSRAIRQAKAITNRTPSFARTLEKQMVTQPGPAGGVDRQGWHLGERGAAYYAEHKDQFTTPASNHPARTARGREVGRQGLSTWPPTKREGESRGPGEGASARAGEPFAQLVAEASEAPVEGQRGLVGPLSASELDAGVRKLIEGLKPEKSPTSPHPAAGWALLQLDSSTPPAVEVVRDGPRGSTRAEKSTRSKRNA